MSTQNYQYSGSNDIKAVAWYEGNSRNASHPVGMKQANELGVSDMSGNVFEWCENWSPSAPGSGAGALHVYRGGSWLSGANSCRVALHIDDNPSYSNGNLGFRVARSSVQ